MRRLHLQLCSKKGRTQYVAPFCSLFTLLAGLACLVGGFASGNLFSSILGVMALFIGLGCTLGTCMLLVEYHDSKRELRVRDIEAGVELSKIQGLSLKHRLLKANTIKDSLFGTDVKDCIFIHSYLEQNHHKTLITSHLLHKEALHAESALVLNTPEDWSQYFAFDKKGRLNLETSLEIYKGLDEILAQLSSQSSLSLPSSTTASHIQAMQKEVLDTLKTEIHQLSTPPSLVKQCFAVVANTSRWGGHDTTSLEEAKKHHILPLELTKGAEAYKGISQTTMMQRFNDQRHTIKQWATQLPPEIEIPFLRTR